MAVIRKPALSLLGSLRKFRFGDTEAEFGEILNEVRPQLPMPTVAASQPRSIENEPPELAILHAWSSIEAAVLALGVQAGLAGNKFPEVLRQLHDKGVLSDQNFDAINGLRALRNLVAHRSEPSVSEAKATEYLAMAGAIGMILDQVTRKVGGAG